MNRVKWLLVGAGDISNKRVAPALASAGGSRIAAVCDIRRDSAAKLAGEHRADGVFVDFFGRKASTPRGAAQLALKFNVPIVVVMTLRTGNGRYPH